MAFTHLIRAVQPPAGEPGDEPYVSVQISQSTDREALLLSELIPLDPVDDDVTDPLTRNITFLSDYASIYVRLSFVKADTTETPYSDWIESGEIAVGGEGWRPTTKEVGSLVRSRLRTKGGALVSDFSPLTIPTKAETEEIIDNAMGEVISEVGNVPAKLYRSAKKVVMLQAAIDIEGSHYPEQVNAGRSPRDVYVKDYERKLLALIEAAAEIANTGEIIPGGPGGEDGDGTLQYNKPFYGFDGDLKIGQVYW